MAEFGVTPAGFIRKRLADIRPEIIAALRNNLQAAGLSGEIETRPDSVMGILIDTFAEREAALWELSEGIYGATYPSSASGINLDHAVSFTGVTRRGAERARCYALCYGEQGTTIPVGAMVRSLTTQRLWLLAESVTISSASCSDVTITPIPQSGALYVVTVNGAEYAYASDASATLPEVVAGLVAAASGSGLIVTSDGAAVRLSSDGRRAFSVGVSGPMSLSNIGSPGLFQSERPSTEAPAVGELSEIVTGMQGWTSVRNLQAGIPGRLVETDAELRARYPSGLFRLGAATYPSLEPNIRDRVSGVTAIKVFENDTDAYDDSGRPPHSVHFVVEGGLDQEIGEAIYRAKAAGIASHGSVEVDVASDDGAIHAVRFDRPSPVYVWVKVAITPLSPSEGIYPSDGNSRVAASINASGRLQGIGQDVVWQKYFSAVYQTPGIAFADLRFAFSADPLFEPQADDFHSQNITIQDFEVARFDPSRIEVL